MNPKKQEHSTISREPELAVLNTLISATHTWTDTQAVLSIALEQVAKLSESDGAECHLVNSAGELEFTAHFNLDPGFAAGSEKIRFPVGTGIPGLAYASQGAIYVTDIASEERYLRRGLAQKAGYRSLICIPLSGMDTLLGTFILYYKDETQPIPELQKILTTVGKQMGIAVERARLFQQTEKQLKELQVLQTVSNALNRSANFQEALEQSLEAVIAAMGLQSGWVVLLDGNQGIRLAAAYNLPSELHPDDWAAMPAPCHCLGLLKQGRLESAINIIECQQLKSVTDPRYPFRHHVSIPLRTGNQVLGNLNLVSPRLTERSFTENEMRMFNAVGNQIGVAVERMRLLEQVKAQRIEEQAALLQLSQALLVESDPQAIMDAAGRMAADMLKVEFAALALVDPEKQDFSGQAAIGWPPDLLQIAQHVPLSADTGLAYALRTRTPLVIPDESRETRFGKPAWITEAGIASSMLAPMIVSGEVIGGLVVNSRARRDWNDDEVRLLSLIASETAQALGRAWQHAHAVERLERITALHDIDVAIMSQLDLEKRLDILLEKVTERLHVDAAAVALIDPDTHELNYAARRGLNGEFFADGFLKVKEGIAGQVAHSGEVAAIPDVSAEPRFGRRYIAERLGIVSYLAVPLQARGAIIGLLELATFEHHEFLSEEIDFFVTLAGQAAIALENARLFEEARQRAAQQGELAEIAGTILSTLQVEAPWPAVTTAVRGTLAANRAALYLYDPVSDRLTCPYASGLSDEYVAEINRRFREVPGGRLLADPRPVVIADAQTDSAAAPIHDLATREGFHSYAAFPLTAPEGPLGALVAYRDLIAPFSPNDIATGQMLAHIVAVAIQNARLFKAERAARERAETLQQVGALLTAQLSLDEVFERLFDLLARVVAYDSVSVQLTGSDGKTYLAAGRGFPDMDEARRVVRGIQKMRAEKQRRWAEGRPLVIPDTHADSNWVIAPGVEYIRSWVGAPLLVKGDLIGVLNVDSRSAGAYDPATGETVMAFANQAAVAIKNARLFESLINEQHNTARLYHLSLELAANLDPEDVAKRALQAATDAMGVSRGNILTVENDGENMRLLAVTGYDRETVSAINQRLNWNTSQGVSGHVIQTRTAVIVPDVSRDPFWVSIPGLDDWVKSMLSVPLVAGNDVVGVLNLLSEQPEFFKTENLSTIAAIASPVALALQNARLFEAEHAAHEQAELLREAARAVSGTLDLDEVLSQILTQLKRMLPYDTASVLLRGEGDLPALVVGTGYTDESTTSQSAGDLLVDSRILRQMALDLQTVLIADVRHHPDWIWVAGAEHVRTFLAVPIVARSRLIGALMIDSVQVGFFNESQVHLAQTLAQHMAIAIENARHYEDMRQRLKELEILADTSSALRKAQSYSGIAPILLAKAVEGLNADAGVLLLLENNALKFAAIHGETNVKTGDTCPQDAGMMRQALESDKPIFIPDVAQIEELHESAVCQSLMGDALSCACVPLQTTASAIGVVYLNWKKKSFLSADESRLLESLAEIAANAISRATLHLQTVRQAQDLVLAYDATIEGWSRALDLRDKETEDHTLRVTNLTLQLAQVIGVSDSELKHIRRGALLHDIGKMGIPDNILRKAGALSDEEWTMMRRHPQLAYELLSPIAYLQPALDIPFCHHEKWDGSGYPRGLKGEEIPLAARIFAVVDVFDALTSDRPYRPAWTKRKATAYIRQQAGIHFDPKVLSVFLKLIGKK